jgi:glycosyltransferase involved in cell wall biosynthesis
MRIALVYDWCYPWTKGGGEKTLWDIAIGLRARGHLVHIFCVKLWEGPDVIEREEIVLHGVCRPTGFYGRSGRRTLLQPLLFAGGLFKTFWNGQAFDCIYCTVFPFFSVFSVWLYRILQRNPPPWVLAWFEVWGRDYWNSYTKSRVRGTIGAAIEWLCSRCCRHHTVLSPLHAGRLQRLLGVAQERIEIIPRGLDLHKIECAKAKRSGRVIYVGRLVDYKNVEIILRAWSKVLQSCPHATFRILGTGPELNRLSRLRTRLGLEKCVEFIEPLQRWEDIINEIATAEILVQPSIREGQSIVALEAMAVRTTVVATLHPESAVSDILRDGVNGLLVEEWNNSSMWAERLRELLSQPALRQRLANAARQDAQSFDWETKIAPRLEYLLARVAAGCKCVRLAVNLENQSVPS